MYGLYTTWPQSIPNFKSDVEGDHIDESYWFGSEPPVVMVGVLDALLSGHNRY